MTDKEQALVAAAYRVADDVGVAITMMNKMYGERVWIEDPLRQIVDEVLNATK